MAKTAVNRAGWSNNRSIVECHVSGRIGKWTCDYSPYFRQMRMHYIKILPGDRVRVDMSPYDLTKGRITFRYKN